jgi:hypothetical protein
VPSVVAVELLGCRTGLKPLSSLVARFDVAALLIQWIEVSRLEVLVKFLAVGFGPVRGVTTRFLVVRRHLEIMSCRHRSFSPRIDPLEFPGDTASNSEQERLPMARLRVEPMVCSKVLAKSAKKVAIHMVTSCFVRPSWIERDTLGPIVSIADGASPFYSRHYRF